MVTPLSDNRIEVVSALGCRNRDCNARSPGVGKGWDSLRQSLAILFCTWEPPLQITGVSAHVMLFLVDQVDQITVFRAEEM